MDNESEFERMKNELNRRMVENFYYAPAGIYSAEFAGASSKTNDDGQQRIYLHFAIPSVDQPMRLLFKTFDLPSKTINQELRACMGLLANDVIDKNTIDLTALDQLHGYRLRVTVQEYGSNPDTTTHSFVTAFHNQDAENIPPIKRLLDEVHFADLDAPTPIDTEDQPVEDPGPEFFFDNQKENGGLISSKDYLAIYENCDPLLAFRSENCIATFFLDLHTPEMRKIIGEEEYQRMFGNDLN